MMEAPRTPLSSKSRAAVATEGPQSEPPEARLKSPLAHGKGASQRLFPDPQKGKLLPDFYRSLRRSSPA
jgi:hypothetical protein